MSRQRPTVFAIALALLLLPITAVGKDPSKPSAEVLSAITARGAMLAAYDKAAWNATDAVEATGAKHDSYSRYIARKTARGWIVDFGSLDEAHGNFLVSYEASQSDSSEHFKVTSFQPARGDTGWDFEAARGVDTALKDFRGVDRPYNVAVLPSETEDLFVYVYLAQTTAGVYPYGADIRYRLSANGSTILEKRQLHKTVLEFHLPASEDQTVAGYHVHVLSDLPEDTDVLLVLQRSPRVPEFVGAGRYVFKIDETGKITVKGRIK